MRNKYTADSPLMYRLPYYFIIVLVLFLVACKSGRQTNPVVTITPTNSVQTKDLTEERVIAAAKNLLNQSKKTVSIQMHYWNSEMTKVPCTQYDVDRGVSCSAPEGANAPYGYKRVPRDVWTCCKKVDYPLYNSIGKWSAEYSDKEDNWTVKYDFKADDLQYHFVWLINDNNGQISEIGLQQ